MRNTFIAATIGLLFVACCPAKQSSTPANPADILSAAEVQRIEAVLSSDDMQGRKAGTPAIGKAEAFIESEFKAAGLQTFGNLAGYRQEFSMIRPEHVSTSGTIDGKQIDIKNVTVITQQPEITVTDQSGFEKVYVKAGQNLFQEVRKYLDRNAVVIVDTAHRKNFGRIAGLRRPSFASAFSQLFILAETDPSTFSVKATHALSEVRFANIVGVLPGRSKPGEFVVFSAHHDHVGIGKPTAEGDSIYNGANDDAAGTTAVIMLAKYFKAMNNNERTLVFVTFTAEEMGGFGSQYFSKQIDPEKVMAMFNIEMIGTESKWGTNSAYITGFEKSDMGTILQRNLEGSGFTFHPDPYPQQQLFLRSDNATLARLGVPAHTISTSKMDVEKYYHTADDEIETLDMKNMAAIIKAIAMSSRGIVAGTETPGRVKN